MINFFIHRAFAAGLVINSSIPFVPKGADVTQTIQGIYILALSISGFLAFAMIVYGGIRYAISGGNPTGISKAKDIITGALIGLVLLGGAYIILRTVNPALVTLQDPGSVMEAAAPLNNANLLLQNGNGNAPIYACIADNNVYACARNATDTTCSTAVGCSSNAKCIQIPVKDCGTTTTVTTATKSS